jgi:hypothetical protein
MPSYWGISSRLMVPVDEGQTEIDKQEYLRKLESTLNEDQMDFEREPGELENRIYETLGDPGSLRKWGDVTKLPMFLSKLNRLWGSISRRPMKPEEVSDSRDPVMAETILGFLEEPRSVMLDGMD